MFKSCWPFWLMLFQVLTKIVPPPPQLGKDSVEHSGYFYIQAASEHVFFFLCYFFQEKNHFVSKSKKECFEKPKRGGEKKNVLKLFSHISALSTRRPSSMQSAVAGCVFCVRVHVCVWATLCLWFTAPPTLSPPFCLLVDCHGEGGYNTERHKSGHFLPLSPTSRGSLSCYKHD